MPRRKRKSTVLEEAQKRLAGLQSIDTKLKLSDDLSIEAYKTLMNEVEENATDYNTHLSKTDEKGAILEDSEKRLRDMSERLLSGVGAIYGKNSNEYEKAGGKKKSERKKPGTSAAALRKKASASA